MANINIWPFKPSNHQRFEQMLKPHLKQLYNLAYRFTGQKHDAEDLVQDIMLKLYPSMITADLYLAYQQAGVSKLY